MKNLFTIILIAGILGSYAQNLQTQKTYYDPYSKTKIYEVYTVIAGTPTKSGSYKRYDREGKLDAEGSYLNGNEQGVWKWYENGIINKLHTYNNGKLEGLCEVYDDKGNKIKTWYMKDGITTKEISYFDNNKMNLLYQRNGINGEWYKNGKKKSEVNVKDDISEGTFTSWYETGIIQSKGTYSKGFKIGKWETFYPDSAKESISDYEAGGKLIKETYWYHNGKLKSERKKISELQFELTNYDSIGGNRESLSRVTYDNSDVSSFRSDSVVVYYDASGNNVHTSKNYKNTHRNGTWKIYYDTDWNQVTDTSKALYYRIITYDYDKIVGKVKDYYLNGKIQGLSDIEKDTPFELYNGDFTNYHPNGLLHDSSKYDRTNKLFFTYTFNDKGILEKSITTENSSSNEVISAPAGIAEKLSKAKEQRPKYRVFDQDELNRTYVVSLYDEKGNVTERKEFNVGVTTYWDDLRKVYAEYYKE